jgi:acyl-CoA hydrolase
MPLVAYPDGVDSARLAPAAAADLLGEPPAEVLLGWTPETRPWLTDHSLRGRTTMAGYALDGAVRAGRIRYLPTRLSAVPTLVRRTRPDVTVVAGVRRGSDLVFLGTVGWGPAAAAAARAVVVEVDEDAPDLGTPVIPGEIAAVVARAAVSASPVPRVPDEVDLQIGRRVAALLPDDATIQLGPGAIAEAIVAGLERPVRIWSGLLTDAMAGLADRDLLRGAVTAGYVWGGRPIVELHRAGRLRLAPVEETHDIARVSAIPRFVACNTALEVGLDGAVNVERVGDRIVAGIGGHADYCAAATSSDGGFSVVALRSTDRRGRSTIVPRVDVVSTPRSDVGLVVTEHGVADLRDADDAQRADRVIAIAAPEHREALRKHVRLAGGS